MKSLRTTVLLSILLTTAPAWAVKPFTADYQANVMGSVSADAQMTLASAGGDRWNYVLSVNSPIATLRQTTVFEDRDGNWRPISGNDFSKMVFKKSQKNASYDWSKGEARWSGDVKDDRMGPVKLQNGDLDAMLLNLALVRDVAAGKPLNYRMVDNGVVREQSYQNLGKDTVTVAGKPRSATKVSRSSDNKQVIVWVVDGLPVPARILQKKDGKDELDLVLKSVH
ncbi:DUF3108 domain-containing protein [Thermomonas sp. HDW16]|uniref:DUF3108 domain-containing protein n=1 Tax=Thermomonas sp. HDW16 TaxID=2714945 RepID=UPI00140A2B63|nr:DUF3108 domain-containing protein [Thermomonas sp. HDW16]QIL20037.1 DUF3108 domain-containing protein [Thermomonas sp. HDW16]